MDTTDLVTAAKADRPASAPTDDLDEQLREQLECPVCACIFFDPVAVLDCLHVFCGACMSQWAGSCEEGVLCPSCRKPVKKVQPDFKTGTLVGLFLAKNPSLKRTQEEVDEMRAIYKPGDKIEMSDYYSDEDEEMEEEEYHAPIPPWRACSCCHPLETRRADPCLHAEYANYVCPEPLIEDEQNRVPMNTQFRKNHFFCHMCDRTVPIIDLEIKNYQCVCCRRLNCSAVFDHCPAGGALQKLSTFTFKIHDFSPNLGYIENQMGDIEKKFFEDHMRSLGLDPRDFVKVMLESMKDEDKMIPRLNLEPEERHNPNNVWIDLSCAQLVIGRRFEKWWSEEKARAGIYDPRDKCWYGRECRTKSHNPAHRDKLNHMCEPTPPDQRRRGARPARTSDFGGGGRM